MSNVRKPGIAFTAVALIIGLFATVLAFAEDMKVKLTGDQEVPPVQTQASGSGTITVNDDKSVSGSITTKGIKATAAHIHEATGRQERPRRHSAREAI